MRVFSVQYSGVQEELVAERLSVRSRALQRTNCRSRLPNGDRFADLHSVNGSYSHSLNPEPLYP